MKQQNVRVNILPKVLQFHSGVKLYIPYKAERPHVIHCILIRGSCKHEIILQIILLRIF